MQRLLPRNNRKCSVDGCDNHGDIRKGLCNMHYRRWRRHGDPLGGAAIQSRGGTFEPPRCDTPGCVVQGCGKVIKAHGYCAAHHSRFKKYGDPLGGGAFRKPLAEQGGAFCCIDGCGRASVTRGMCSAHYARWRRLGDATAGGPLLRRQNLGGKQIDALGYVFWMDRTHPQATKNGRVAEHRAVMVEKLGRDLLTGENVHHINGCRHDNRPENLELWVTMQPAGQRPADLVAFAKEILHRYSDEVLAALDP